MWPGEGRMYTTLPLPLKGGEVVSDRPSTQKKLVDAKKKRQKSRKCLKTSAATDISTPWGRRGLPQESTFR